MAGTSNTGEDGPSCARMRGARAAVWGTGQAAPRPLSILGDLRARLFAALAADIRAEAEAGRLVLWLPVLFAVGILLYFGADQEPSLVACLLLTAALLAATLAARARVYSFAVLAGVTALACGFTLACLQTARITRPILIPPAGTVRLTGFVEHLEKRATADRILLRVETAQARGLAFKPERVRLSLPRGSAPTVGAGISVSARLLPPLGPAMAGEHDFGRAPWFAGIDAVGFALGAPKAAPLAQAPPLSVRIAALVHTVRVALAARIRLVLSGAAADIAVALVTGDRSSIAPAVEESMRLSGLTHVLSISGLHMALVAGTLFALVRGLLALFPPLALGAPVKSLAALCALLGSALYLVLSGNDVAAQRSFLMLGLVLLGVIVGRAALTLRSVAVAAVLVLAAAPVSVLDPGMQMSFAATLALVAAFERLRPLRPGWTAEGWVARAALKLGVFVGGLALTSLVAGLATAPYGALHFQRIGAYGLLSNLAAMPAVSFLVMPFGLLGVLLLPFGLDSLAWPIMGLGIDIMVGVSNKVAALPGAGLRTDWFNAPSVLAASLALLCLCLLRGRLAAIAVVPALAALALGGAPQRPDILIAPNGRTVAVRAADGRLSILGATSNRMVADQWLSRESDGRTSRSEGLADAFRCDKLGCTASTSGGVLAVSRRPEGLEADCLNAALIVTPYPAPKRCPAQVITPANMVNTGTLALFRAPEGTVPPERWRIVPARSTSQQRPWMPPLPPVAEGEREAGAVEQIEADAAR
ncbi:ComEC/Rec2 family competence protein [Roseixanthobacter glucoisosaccharinicivorans]|uniref:ComEC/Rec2 family competence protein n=1 Tax=Roseixanthobacter glucoisosaccharinicivorans TaxID=3119923 RepID=UPI0037272C47